MKKGLFLLLVAGVLFNASPAFAQIWDIPLEFKNVDLDVASHYPMEDFLVIKNKTDLKRVIDACSDESALGRDLSKSVDVDFSKNMLIAVL